MSLDNFKLTEDDAPHLEKLKKVSFPQWDTLQLTNEAAHIRYDTMASLLNVSVGTVKSRLHRGRHKIIQYRKEAASGQAIRGQAEQTRTEGQ